MRFFGVLRLKSNFRDTQLPEIITHPRTLYEGFVLFSQGNLGKSFVTSSGTLMVDL